MEGSRRRVVVTVVVGAAALIVAVALWLRDGGEPADLSGGATEADGIVAGSPPSVGVPFGPVGALRDGVAANDRPLAGADSPPAADTPTPVTAPGEDPVIVPLASLPRTKNRPDWGLLELSVSPLDGGYTLRTDRGDIVFDAPTWKTGHNPTTEEGSRLDAIDAELADGGLSSDAREALLSEKDALNEGAQRPSKQVGGSVMWEADGAEIARISWMRVYHQYHPSRSGS